MPSEILHGWRNRSKPSVLFGFLLSVSPTSSRPDSLGFRLGKAAKTLNYRIQPDAALRHAFESLRDEIRADYPFQQEAAIAYIRLILALIFRHLTAALPSQTVHSQPDPGNSRSMQLYLQAKAFIESNLAFGVSLTDVARHLGISARHANRLFKTREKNTMGQFIAARRLELARKLLRENRDTPVKQIASLCGFKDVSYFCRFFKEHTGISPACFGKNSSSNTR